MEHRTYHPHRHPSPACRLRLVYKRRRTCRTTQQHPHLQLPPPSRPNPHLRHPPHSRTLRRTPPLPSSHSKPPQNPPLPIFHHLTHAPIQHTLQTLHSEHQLHRLTTDIDQLNELPLRTYAPWAWAQIILLIYLLILNHLQPTLLWPSTILLLSASFLLPLLGQRLGINLARRHSQLNEQRRHTLLQPLQALTQLLLWQRWEDYQHTYQQRQQQFDQLETRQQHLASLLIASQQTLLALTLLYTLSHAQLSPAILLALSLTLLGLNEILTPLASQFTSLGTSLSAKQRLNQLLIPPHHTHPKRPIPTKNLTLSAHQLSVQYPNAIAPLTNLNFIIKSGQTLLITGKSGSGKTTLLTTLAQEIPQKAEPFI
nr:ATP-binding cassette domain-containing protein [Rappaport israeli]